MCIERLGAVKHPLTSQNKDYAKAKNMKVEKGRNAKKTTKSTSDCILFAAVYNAAV